MANKISINNISSEITKDLRLYSEDVINGVKLSAKKASTELVKLTKQDSPVRSGRFKKSIASKKLLETNRSISYLWYVKSPEYRLTHLIKNGHQTKNGGRTKANDFITKNYNSVETQYEKDVENVIKNGGII